MFKGYWDCREYQNRTILICSLNKWLQKTQEIEAPVNPKTSKKLKKKTTACLVNVSRHIFASQMVKEKEKFDTVNAIIIFLKKTSLLTPAKHIINTEN